MSRLLKILRRPRSKYSKYVFPGYIPRDEFTYDDRCVYFQQYAPSLESNVFVEWPIRIRGMKGRGESNLTDGEKRWKLLLFARLSSKLSPMFINRTNNRCWEEPWERELIDLKSRWIEEDLAIFETKIQQRDYEWIFVHFSTFPKVGFPFPGTFRNVCRVFGDRSMRRGEVARSEREIKRCWNFWARNGYFSENCKRIITR